MLDVALINQLIFGGAALVAVSIVLGMFSSRLGAPLLLVFLAIGMAVGEDGLGVPFDDFRLTYLLGSIALAIILFDGGMRTPRATFKLAMWPALSLATVGVLLTAAFLAVFAVWALSMNWLQALLVGSVVASTDAAAVFLLLHARGTELTKRVQATLELESGMNDPMAVFLTILCVELLLLPNMHVGWDVPLFFVRQMVGGAAIGIAGGYVLLWIINKVEIAAGQYPILAAAIALSIFAGAQVLDMSGYLAVYLAGLVLGNNRHRAQAVIGRFHDGLAWLSQIVMFLMLGLLVTPSHILRDIWAEVAVALALILVARPLAVIVGLAPFRFKWRETAFISWVGLRGAVPIFLASIPVLAQVPNAQIYFNVAFVVVILSLLIQGWTVASSAQFLGLALPPSPEAPERQGIDMPASADREAASWRVAPDAPGLSYPFAELPLPRRTRIIAVIRDGTVMNRETLARIQPEDYVIAVVPPEQLIELDKLFSTPPRTRRWFRIDDLGEFALDPQARMVELCAQYGLTCDHADLERTLAEVMATRLGAHFIVGDRIKLGEIELVVRKIDRGKIASVGLELEPADERLPVLRLWRRLTGQRT